MKKQLILIFALISFYSFSQKIAIEYLVTENTNDAILSTSIPYNLIINEQKSVYYNTNDSISQFKFQNLAFDIKKIGELTQVKLSDNHNAYIKQDYFFKDYTNNKLFYNEILINKKVYITETLNLFNWEIVPDFETQLFGYKCQKAIATFRGRTYEALFSIEIAPFGGPWKFDGLPGVILNVKSLDNYFVIEAQKISINVNSLPEVKNIYDKQLLLTWAEFKETYKKKLQQQLKRLKSMSEDGDGGSIKVTDKIEDLELPELKF